MEKIIWNSFLDEYFDDLTMSMHIKENRQILKKKWWPGKWEPVVESTIATPEMMKEMIKKIFDEVEKRSDWFLEIDKTLSKIVQLWPYRIVIVYPPLSDGLEMTIVKPIKKLVIEDYNLDSEIVDLLQNSSKGILVSGSPGSWKTTFAQALVWLYHKDNKIIKTLESPRDLLVSDDVVQYSFTYGSHDELRDILLLSRPDYTVYDEIRNKPDFELYKDLRLTWIWLIWVIHATRPVDSIQRFLWTIDMGIIPQVIDTVIFLDKWKIWEILQLKLVVKVPQWMQSEDLARPVIQVQSFVEKKVKYEIYSFWEQIVVVPIDDIPKWGNKTSAVNRYAQEAIKSKLEAILPCPFLSKVRWSGDLNLYVPVDCKAWVIWKWWQKIMDLEKRIWIKINVFTFDELPIIKENIKTQISNDKEKMSIQFSKEYEEKEVCILSSGQLYFLSTNSHAQLILNKAKIVKSLEKNWFLVIDLLSL